MTETSRFPRLHQLVRGLRISRLAFFQALFLVLALTVLYQIGLGPWLDARAETARSQELAKLVADFESKHASLDPADYAPEPVPDVDNAAHWALAGAAAVVDDDGFGQTLSRFAKDPNALDPSDPNLLLGLERNEPALSLLHRMAGLRRSDFGIEYDEGSQLRLPPLDQLYAAGALLGLDALVAASTGQGEEAIVSLRSLDALAGAVAGEAPRQAYLAAVYLERLFNRTLRAMASQDELASHDASWPRLVQVASQPAHAGGLCTRFRRMLYFDAAVRIAQGPEHDVLRQIGIWWLPKMGPPAAAREHWMTWAQHALSGVQHASERCAEIHPLRGVTPLMQGAITGRSDVELPAVPTRTSGYEALRALNPEVFGFIEIVRRNQHRRLFAVVALTLLDQAQRRGVDPVAINDLPAHVTDPIAQELAACVEIQSLDDGRRELIAIRNQACDVWIDESLRWTLPAPTRAPQTGNG